MTKAMWADLWRLYPREMVIGIALIAVCGVLLNVCVWALLAAQLETEDEQWLD